MLHIKKRNQCSIIAITEVESYKQEFRNKWIIKENESYIVLNNQSLKKIFETQSKMANSETAADTFFPI